MTSQRKESCGFVNKDFKGHFKIQDLEMTNIYLLGKRRRKIVPVLLGMGNCGLGYNFQGQHPMWVQKVLYLEPLRRSSNDVGN